MATTLKVNGKEETLGDEVDVNTPLLWALRTDLGLTGTKFGCGLSQCGACTVHIDGVATHSCITAIKDAVGHEITTIEGLGTAEKPHPLQEAWVKYETPQCGYCQSGQLMMASSFLAQNPHPTDEEIIDAMKNNLCRCGTYSRIFSAIKSVAGAN